MSTGVIINISYSLIKASWRRWPIFIIWLLYATNNAFQFLEFTSVMEPIAYFYHVTESQVLWTTGVVFIAQIIGALPVALMPELFELRISGTFKEFSAIQYRLYCIVFTL